MKFMRSTAMMVAVGIASVSMMLTGCGFLEDDDENGGMVEINHLDALSTIVGKSGKNQGSESRVDSVLGGSDSVSGNTYSGFTEQGPAIPLGPVQDSNGGEWDTSFSDTENTEVIRGKRVYPTFFFDISTGNEEVETNRFVSSFNFRIEFKNVSSDVLEFINSESVYFLEDGEGFPYQLRFSSELVASADTATVLEGVSGTSNMTYAEGQRADGDSIQVESVSNELTDTHQATFRAISREEIRIYTDGDYTNISTEFIATTQFGGMVEYFDGDANNVYASFTFPDQEQASETEGSLQFDLDIMLLAGVNEYEGEFVFNAEDTVIRADVWVRGESQRDENRVAQIEVDVRNDSAMSVRLYTDPEEGVLGSPLTYRDPSTVTQ